MKRNLILLIITIFFIIGCATPALPEPKVPELPPFGSITSVQTEAAAEEEPAVEEPFLAPVETASVVPSIEVEETAFVEEAAAEDAVVEEIVIEEPEPVAEQPVEIVQVEPEVEVESEVEEETVVPEAAVVPIVPRAAQREPQEPQEVVIYPEVEQTVSAAAAKEVEDRNSTLFRAAWFGLPVLLLLLVILFVEIIRWFVYKKPLFGWTAPAGISEDPVIRQETGKGFFRKAKEKITGKFSGFIDRLYKDLDDDDEKES